MPTARRYVFDANTLVSATLLRSSIPRRAFDRACKRGKILLSRQTVAELEDVLGRPKLDRYISESQRMAFLVALIHEAEMIVPSESIALCRDPKDDVYLELAVAGHASCLITGDADLLAMHPFRGIPIVKARYFLDSDL